MSLGAGGMEEGVGVGGCECVSMPCLRVWCQKRTNLIVENVLYVNSRHRDHPTPAIVSVIVKHACGINQAFWEGKRSGSQMAVLDHVCVIWVHIKSKTGRAHPSRLSAQEGGAPACPLPSRRCLLKSRDVSFPFFLFALEAAVFSEMV